MLQFDADFASVRVSRSVRSSPPFFRPSSFFPYFLPFYIRPRISSAMMRRMEGGGPPEGPLGVARQGRSGRARPPSIQSAPGQGLNTVAHEVPAEQDQPNMSNIPLYYHFFHITRPPPRRPLDGICSIDTSCFFLPIV